MASGCFVTIKRASLPRLLLFAASALSLCCGGFFSGKADAAYDYNPSQIAPSVARDLKMADLAAILNETAPNSPYLVAYGLTATDAGGSTVGAAPIKVIQSGTSDCPYLAVFHTAIPNRSQFATYLGCSTELKTWHTRGAIHDSASQPDIRILYDDSVLYAEEYITSGRFYVRVQYYGNTGAQTGLLGLIANPALAPTKSITLPATSSATADGTPEFGRIDYNGSIVRSKIEIRFHYFHLGSRDLNAVGTLTNFRIWSRRSDNATNNLVASAGGNGKIGDREVFKVGSTVYEVIEAQVSPTSGNDFGSWRLFLINKTAGTIQRLGPRLAGGAQSLGNPTVSLVTLPNGVPGLIFTCFIFSQNRGTTPSGGYLFVYPLG